MSEIQLFSLILDRLKHGVSDTGPVRYGGTDVDASDVSIYFTTR